MTVEFCPHAAKYCNLPASLAFTLLNSLAVISSDEEHVLIRYISTY